MASAIAKAEPFESEPVSRTSLTLADCADILDARRKPINADERSSRMGETPYYGATGRVGWIDGYLFDEELLLLGEDGAPFLDKSKPIAYLISGKSWVNNHAHVLRARPQITTNSFLKYFLDAFDFTDYVQGSTRDKLTKSAMCRIPVDLPPLAVQREVAALLDSVYQHRDMAYSALERARELLMRLRQFILVAACTGRLTADWRKTTTGASRPLEQALARADAAKRRSPRHADLEAVALPELADAYVITSLDRAAELIQYGSSKRADADETRGIPMVRMGNIQDGRLKLDDLKYVSVDNDIEGLMLNDGDFLFNRTNSPELVGKSAVFHLSTPMSFASYIIRVRFAPDVAEPDFVNLWMNSAWGKAWARQVKTDGVSQSNINGKKLSTMPIPLPPIDEQREIVHRAHRLLALADGLLDNVETVQRLVNRAAVGVLSTTTGGAQTNNPEGEHP